ncbi:rho guanine nucleotide exchange factor 17 [Caerostris extrusa]|uniref:Rho guanine nucleotide exchange factor 17 n=1 Tax=Caerostris extrusa TaxID=172846 RepID=A0AAV4SQK8_CAEEX|nr:rho guanine nucleotide exchange factor 17 [Caerostris extrusa]
MRDIATLEEDVHILNQIKELASRLSSHHQTLDDVVKDLTNGVSKQMLEKQNSDYALISLEMTITSDSLVHAATLGLNQEGVREVWVCNSDGYVGQVCVLSLLSEPTVMSCNGVCNARILAIASVPATCTMVYDRSRWKVPITENAAGVNDSSEEEEETECIDDDKGKDENRKRGNSLPKDDSHEKDDMDDKLPTMWLGTEDGCIHVYNGYDNIRTKKNKIKNSAYCFNPLYSILR